MQLPGAFKEVSLPYFNLHPWICTLQVQGEEEHRNRRNGGGEKRGGGGGGNKQYGAWAREGTHAGRVERWACMGWRCSEKSGGV